MLSLPVGAPGVYIREVTGPATIAGVGTGTAAFIGPAFNGPFRKPVRITNFDQFKRIFGSSASDGFPFLTGVGRSYYMAYGVSGFFENGGQQAVIVRVGTALPARKAVVNGKSVGGLGETVFVFQAKAGGVAGNNLSVEVKASPEVPVIPVTISGQTGTLEGSQFNLTGTSTSFVVGDAVSFVATATGVGGFDARVARIDGGTKIILDQALSTTPPSDVPGTLSSRAIDDQTRDFRVSLPVPRELVPGALLRLTFQGAAEKVARAYVQSVSSGGVVSLQEAPQLETGVTLTSADLFQTVKVAGFAVIAKNGDTLEDQVERLSLSPLSPRYVLRQEFSSIEIVAPKTPPTANTIAAAQPVAISGNLAGGVDDTVASLAAADYRAALDVLRAVDGINLVCIPDAAFAPDGAAIEKALVDHCVGCRDRFAILDVLDRLEPLVQRPTVTASGGFAALYYPHLLVEEQLTVEQRRLRAPRIIPIPPSGHVAGVYARVDAEGVHVAPANQEIRGVLGVSVSVANDEQGPLNDAGVDVLRVFADDGRVLVWGARTTAPAEQTDWRYVNVRRLLTFIELSLDRSLRWAVFRPNDRSLWTSLQVTISEFLRKQWRQGALVGANEEQAFRVRIDEGLNPPSEMALGKLNIEIRVAPSRPAEFIIINIGLSQQGTEIRETP